MVKAEEMLMSHVWGTWGTTGNFHIFQSPTKLPGVCENSIGNFIALPLTLPRLLVPSAGCESGSVYFPCNCPPTSGWWWFSARFSRSMWAVLHLLLYYPSWCPLVFATSCPQDMYPSFLGGGGYWKMSECEFCRWTFLQFPDYLYGDSLLTIDALPIAQAFY